MGRATSIFIWSIDYKKRKRHGCRIAKDGVSSGRALAGGKQLKSKFPNQNPERP